MSERRDELIEKIVDYLKQRGLAGLSLRPLAAEIGTSARLLIFHFGSREGLIEAAMGEIRRRMQHSLSRHQAAAEKKSGIILSFWTWATHPANICYVRLLFEAQVLALQDPKRYAHYIENTSDSWLEAIKASLVPGKDNRALATLCMAVIDGLLLEYMGTGDARRTGKAIRLFQDIMEEHASREGSKQ
jgi:AcrR family transcriptional regulator